MKTLLRLFLVPLSFLFSSLSFAQTNCTKHLGGEVTCSGPGGYSVEAREHLNGQTSYYDSRGNVGTVTHTINGGVNVSPTVVGSAPPPPGAGLSLSRAGNGLESISPPSITPGKYCPLCEP